MKITFHLANSGTEFSRKVADRDEAMLAAWSALRHGVNIFGEYAFEGHAGKLAAIPPEAIQSITIDLSA